MLVINASTSLLNQEFNTIIFIQLNEKKNVFHKHLPFNFFLFITISQSINFNSEMEKRDHRKCGDFLNSMTF